MCTSIYSRVETRSEGVELTDPPDGGMSESNWYVLAPRVSLSHIILSFISRLFPLQIIGLQTDRSSVRIGKHSFSKFFRKSCKLHDRSFGKSSFTAEYLLERTWYVQREGK